MAFVYTYNGRFSRMLFEELAAAPTTPAANKWMLYFKAAGLFHVNDAGTELQVATLTGTETLTNKTLTTPTIASFANATHGHTNAAGGGTLDAAALASGVLNNARVNWASPDAIGGTTPAAGAFTGVTIGVGSLGSPSLAISGDTDTGLYQFAADQIGLATGGVSAGIIRSAGESSLIAQDAGTNTSIVVLNLTRRSTATPTTNFGAIFRFNAHTSTNTDREVGRWNARWNVATDASRAGEMLYQVQDSGGNRTVMTMRANGSAGMLSFFGATPVVRAAALTQTYSTADRTLSAYTPDDESAAYTGIDNAQAGTVYARLSDLNALRAAYENLRVFCEDVAQFLNALVDDQQAYGLEQ